MRIGKWARLLLVAAPLSVGCGDFWQAPNNDSFTLTSSPTSVTVALASNVSSTITVTPANSFTGTVTLTCAVTSPSGATNPLTCSLSPSSVSITSTTAETSTLTASSSSNTTAGGYQVTVTGTSGSATETVSVCVSVGTSSSSCSSTTSGIFYILNSNTVSGNKISSGSLTQLSASTLPAGTGNAMAIDPTGTLLYVATTDGIFLYNVGSSGALPATPTTISQTGSVAAIQVDPSGKWLLAAYSVGNLEAIPITSSGTEDSSRTVQVATLAGLPIQMAISPSQTNVIVAVAQGTTGTQVFPFTSGGSAPIGSVYKPTLAPSISGASAESVAVDPQDRFLYIGETASSTGSGGLRVFQIGSSGASEVSGSPFPSGGTGPHAILAESSGTYVYVVNWAGNATGAGFQVASTGSLTELSSTFSTGSEPTGLAEDNTNSYVMVVSSQGSPYFDAYSFTSSTGSLGSGITSSTVTDPVAIVAVPK